MTARPALADVTDPRFTADQLATLAAFDAAEYPQEVREAAVVEVVARAIYGEQGCRIAWHRLIDEDRAFYRTTAAAAVAAYRAMDGGAAEAVRRVEALADEIEGSPIPIWTDAVAARIRAALAPQAGDER